MNCNLPPIEVLVRNNFIKDYPEDYGYTGGFLVSVRALSNQSLQFSILLKTGALYTGLPAHAICFTKNDKELSLSDSQMWDNISANIQVFTLDLLRYMDCTVKVESGIIIEGSYLFTIDYLGDNDLSRHPEHWKQLHALKTEHGLILYPQYRIQFKDKALCPDSDNVPRYKHNDTIWLSDN